MATQKKTIPKPKVVPVQMAQVRERIYATIKRIPRGRVSNYGAVAELAGFPRRARLVGTILRTTPDSTRVPWYRVIGASGRVVFPPGSAAFIRQCERLAKEGVKCPHGRIDMKRYGWPEKDAQIDQLLWGEPRGSR